MVTNYYFKQLLATLMYDNSKKKFQKFQKFQKILIQFERLVKALPKYMFSVELKTRIAIFGDVLVIFL